MVRTTIKKLQKFLNNIDDITHDAMVSMKDILMDVLYNKIFKSYSNVYQIRTKAELRNLIRSGSMPPVARYSSEYLRRKRAMGEYYPHIYQNYGFYGNTFAEVEGKKSLRMFVPDKSFFHKGGANYGEIHEATKSVVKGTILLAWDDLIAELLNTYTNYF